MWHSRWGENFVPIGRGIWGQSFGRRLRQDRQGSAALVPGLWHWECLHRCGKPIPGPGVQVRSMLVAGCARRAVGARRSRRFRRGECVPFWKASAPFPAWERHRFGARNEPHIFFCLGKRKRAAPGTKENRLFIGLLVRPVETGLVSSSCAKRWTFPERSRRTCPVSNNLLVQIGLLCATAPLPLNGQKKIAFAPAGKKLATNAQPSGSGARGTTGPLCTLKSAPNFTVAA